MVDKKVDSGLEGVDLLGGEVEGVGRQCFHGWSAMGIFVKRLLI